MFIIGLALASYFDYRYKRIPELFSFILWIALVFAQLPLELPFYCFVLAWGLNYLTIILTNKEAYGWGDILIFPPYAAFISSISSNFIVITWGIFMFAFAVELGLLVQWRMAERRADLGIGYMFKQPSEPQIPFIPFLALGFVIGLFI